MTFPNSGAGRSPVACIPALGSDHDVLASARAHLHELRARDPGRRGLLQRLRRRTRDDDTGETGTRARGPRPGAADGSWKIKLRVLTHSQRPTPTKAEAVEEHPCRMAAHRALPFLVDDDLAHGCNVRRDTTCVLSSDSEHLADVAADGRPAVEHLALGGSRRNRRTRGRRGRGLDGGAELEALDDLGAACSTKRSLRSSRWGSRSRSDHGSGTGARSASTRSASSGRGP